MTANCRRPIDRQAAPSVVQIGVGRDSRLSAVMTGDCQW